MRILTNGEQQLLIITSNNDVCSFVGKKPAQPAPVYDQEPARERATPERATIAQSLMAACASFAESLQRGAAHR